MRAGASSIPGSEMQDVEEGSERVTGDFANLGLLHEGLVEEVGRISLFAILCARSILAVLVLLLL
jgi:hypothetical protein